MSTADVRGTAVKRGGRRGPRVGGRQVAWAAAVSLAAAWLAAAALGTRYSPMGMALDALVLLSLLLALRLSARGPIALWMTCVLYALLLVAAPAFKVAQLQVPILAADGVDHRHRAALDGHHGRREPDVRRLAGSDIRGTTTGSAADLCVEQP